MNDNKPQTIPQLAEQLMAMSDDEKRELFTFEFINDEPKQKVWMPVMLRVMPAAVVANRFAEFVQKPRIDPFILIGYQEYFEFYTNPNNTTDPILPLDEAATRFDPANTAIDRQLDKRITKGDAVVAMHMVKENPHVMATIAAFQTFFADYISELKTETIKQGSYIFGSLNKALNRLDRTMNGNAGLFGGTMALHLMLDQRHHARQNGLAAGEMPGELTAEDFARFMPYATARHIFVRREPEKEAVICPFAAQFRAAGNATTTRTKDVLANDVMPALDGEGFLPGDGLWQLHQAVAPLYREREAELKQLYMRFYWAGVNKFDVTLPEAVAHEVKAVAATAPARPAAVGCPYHSAQAVASPTTSG